MIGRRTFTKNFSILAACAAFQPCRLMAAFAPTKLDFFFHGLWAFIVTSNDITAVTPGTCEHCFVAGSFEDDPLPFDAPQMTLSGVSAGSGKFDPNKNFITDLPPGFDPSQFRSQVYLSKIPDSIDSRRVGSIIFSNFGQKSLAMVQRLSYSVSSAPTLSNFDGWTQHPTGGKVNIHMYAEPNVLVGSGHAATAMDDLCTRLKLNASVQFIGLDPGYSSVEDEMLYERGVDCVPDCAFADSPPALRKKARKILPHRRPHVQFGPDVANCMSIVLNKS